MTKSVFEWNLLKNQALVLFVRVHCLREGIDLSGLRRQSLSSITTSWGVQTNKEAIPAMWKRPWQSKNKVLWEYIEGSLDTELGNLEGITEEKIDTQGDSWA